MTMTQPAKRRDDADRAATINVLSQIRAERVRQDTLWGEQNHPDRTGPRIAYGVPLCYMEEAARDARLNCKHRAADGTVGWLDILREEVFEAFAEDDPVKLRAELVQAAAVIVNWIEAIDRRDLRDGNDG